jgi:hypothetical protein
VAPHDHVADGAHRSRVRPVVLRTAARLARLAHHARTRGPAVRRRHGCGCLGRCHRTDAHLYSAISAWSAADLFWQPYTPLRARSRSWGRRSISCSRRRRPEPSVALAGAVVEGRVGAGAPDGQPIRHCGWGALCWRRLAADRARCAVGGISRLLADTVAHTSLDLLHYSLHPWNAALLALQTGLVLWGAAAAGAATLVLRVASLGWRIARGEWRVRLLSVTCWSLHTSSDSMADLPPSPRGRSPAFSSWRSSQSLRDSSQGPLPPGIAGLPLHAAGGGPDAACARLLSRHLRTRATGEGRTGRSAVRPSGAQSAADHPDVDAAEPAGDRRVPRPGRSGLDPAGSSWFGGADEPVVPGLAPHRPRGVPDHVIGGTVRP